jgi:Domain of unknown function (DUF4351)
MQIVTSWMEEGIEKGLEQGRQEGEKIIVLRQLSRRLGPLPRAVQQHIGRLSTDGLENLADALLDFRSIADLEAWLTKRKK